MDKRTDWFENSRLGLFLHWGLYAIPARGEWVRSHEKISIERYQPFFHEFNPSDFDPASWAKLAKEAGMKYAVLTAKHHDGFCLFDSALTDYKATNTPCGRDLVRDFLDAFRAEGLKVGLYYSLLDWHHPDYPHYGDRHHPMRDDPAYSNNGRNFSRYLAYMHGQVRELLTNYGHLDILWFDFSYDDMTGETWRATELVQMVRELQPWILIDNRLGGSGAEMSRIREGAAAYAGDFASPEQTIPVTDLTDADGEHIPWESCMTLNDHWGYCSGDSHYKSAKMLVRSVVECVSKNGNILLNVGPDARGRFPEEAVRLLGEMGSWMAHNGASIYGCGKSEYPKPDWGRLTQNGRRLYAHILEERPTYFTLSVPRDRVLQARLVCDGSEILLEEPWNLTEAAGETHFTLHGRSYPLPDERDTVVEFLLKE